MLTPLTQWVSFGGGKAGKSMGQTSGVSQGSYSHDERHGVVWRDHSYTDRVKDFLKRYVHYSATHERFWVNSTGRRIRNCTADTHTHTQTPPAVVPEDTLQYLIVLPAGAKTHNPYGKGKRRLFTMHRGKKGLCLVQGYYLKPILFKNCSVQQTLLFIAMQSTELKINCSILPAKSCKLKSQCQQLTDQARISDYCSNTL